MPELETRALKGVEIIGVGTWDASTGRFTVTDADLATYVASFDATKDALKIPAKLGHDEGQRLLQQDGYPAAGWLERLYVEDFKLIGDFEKVPAKIADLMEARAYRNVSAEIWHDVTVGADQYDSLLMGVAFLGEDIPACTTLKDVYELYGAKVSLAAPPTSKPRPSVFASKVETITTAPKKAPPKGTSLRTRVEAAVRHVFKVLAEADVSHEAVRDSLQEAIDNRWGGMDGYAWIADHGTFDDHVVVQKGDTYYSVPYTRADDGTIALGEPTEVEQSWTPATTSASHKKAGSTGKEDHMAITKTLATALGLPETADEPAVLKAITELQGKTKLAADNETDCKAQGGKWVDGACQMPDNASLRAEVARLTRKEVERDATSAVDTAIRAKKITPANRDSMIAFALADPKAFTTFAEKAAVIPGLTGTVGTDTDAPLAKSAGDELNEKIAAAMTADAKLEWAAARAQVTRANPDLARRYVEESRGTSARLS